MENGELDTEQELSKSTATLWEYITSSEFRPSLIASAGVLILQQFDGINSIIFTEYLFWYLCFLTTQS